MRNNLNKINLYKLYVEDKKSDEYISNEYNIEKNKIRRLRKKYNININQRFMADFNQIGIIYKKFKYKIQMEDILQDYVGIPKTSDLDIQILYRLKDQREHDIEELWDLSDKDYNPSKKEEVICGNNNNLTLYYRINWCVYRMLKEKLIEEVKERKYKITSKGIGKYNSQKNTEKIAIEKKQLNAQEQYKKLIEVNEEEYRKIKKNKKHSNKLNKQRAPRKINFEKINKEKTELGKFCEEMVLYKEKERIIKEGREDLISEIIWLSEKDGDGAGYDIESVRKIGNKYQKVYIEVKGTSKKNFNNFYVTINELKASWDYKDKYYVCQVADARGNHPKIKYTNGEIDKNFELNAIQYEAKAKEE